MAEMRYPFAATIVNINRGFPNARIIAMRDRLIQWGGIAWTVLYAALVVWLYAAAPQSIAEVRTQASVAAGTYEVDRARFDARRELFLREQYAAARGEWERADPARRDARTQRSR